MSQHWSSCTTSFTDAETNPRSPSHPVSIFFILTYSTEVLALDSYPTAHTSSILNPAMHTLNNYQYLYLNYLTRPEVNLLFEISFIAIFNQSQRREKRVKFLKNFPK